MCCLKLLWGCMQIPGRIAVNFWEENNKPSLWDGDQHRRMEALWRTTAITECWTSLSCVSWTLSVCFCSCGLSNTLMAERLQRRLLDGFLLPSWTITLIWSLEMRDTFPGSLAWVKDQNRSSKQPRPLQGWADEHKYRIHRVSNNYVNWVQRRSSKGSVCHRSSMLLNLFIDPGLQD